MPALSPAPDGRLDAVFYDRRHHPRNVGTDVSYTYSTDGGHTFAPSIIVTGAPSSSQIGQRYPVPSAAGQVEFGSRLALASFEERALTAWTDIRNSLPRTAAQDIFAASVHPPASPAGTNLALLAAGAGAVVVLALAALAVRRRRQDAERPPEVAVTLDEYRFDVEGALPAGRVVFRFTNAGQEQHRPLLLPLTDDIPPIDEQVRGDERRVLTPFAGLNTIDPGEQGASAVDLEPGRRYALVCLMAGDDGETHAVKGMTWEARAGVDEGSG